MFATRRTIGRPSATTDDPPTVELTRLKRRLAWLPLATVFLAVSALLARAFVLDLAFSIAVLAIVLSLQSLSRLGARVLASLSGVLDERAELQAALGAMREMERHFRGLAHHDGLTGLPNHRLFEDRLSLAIAHCARQKSRLAVLYLDLDGFKAVNDSCGHAVGDRVLVEVADRIRNSVRAEDTVARLGGDEFAVLLPSVTGGADAGRVADKILEALGAPFRLDGHQAPPIRASVGVGLFPDDGPSAGAIVRSADAAMYRAKPQRGQLEPA